LISFPTKRHWREDSDIELIKRSAQELVSILKDDPAKRVLFTRPGCGNGNLDWEDVRPILQTILSYGQLPPPEGGGLSVMTRAIVD
jgi:hypothetical protein